MQDLLPAKRIKGLVSVVTPVRFDLCDVARTVSRFRARRYGFSVSNYEQAISHISHSSLCDLP
jgi:hypothetical protein